VVEFDSLEYNDIIEYSLMNVQLVEAINVENSPNLIRIIRLLQHGADANCAGGSFVKWTAMHHACRLGHIHIAELLLKFGADINKPNFFGESPLFCASMRGRTGVVEFLLQKGANINEVNDHGRTPLSRAISNGKLLTVASLLKYGADTNLAATTNGQTPLLITCKKGNEEMLELLLNHEGVDTSYRDDSGLNALHIARENDHTNIIRRLMIMKLQQK